MTDTFYIVTGINRLTGEREPCSMAAPKNVAEQLLQAWKGTHKRNKAYTHLRTEPYSPLLNFKKVKDK